MARKPKIELYWVENNNSSGIDPEGYLIFDHKVNWRMIAANGEVLCQCTQGFRDKTDALRNLDAIGEVFGLISFTDWSRNGFECRIVGPGRKPK